MAFTSRPTRFKVDGCPTLCGFNPRNLPPGAYDRIHSWYEAGDTRDEMVRKLQEEFNHKVNVRVVSNHRNKHMARDDQFQGLDEFTPSRPEKKLSDLEILDKMIQAGAKGLDGKSVRISPEMTLKAMDLRLKLTQGSVFDDFMSAVSKAFGGDEAAPSAAQENVAAQLSGGELEAAGDDEPE